MRAVAALLVAGSVAISACERAATAAPASPATERTAAANPAPLASPSPTPRCPPQPFDKRAALGPEFLEQHFPGDESRTIAEQFLIGLSALYAGEAGDPCRFFTSRGLEQALAADTRLRAAQAAETTVRGRLILRGALETDYDLRLRPPIVSLDLIFDVEAGTTFTNVASGISSASPINERMAFHVAFVFDGHVWRADRIGPVSEDNAHFAATPAPITVGPACTAFVHDPVGAAFDDRPGRVWCDGNGRGRFLHRTNQQYAFLTRYPCDRGQAAILHIGHPLGARMDPLVRREYVRDPAGEFLANGWLAEPYDGQVSLPSDAVDSGWTNGNIDLWLSPNELERAIYLVRGDVVERWPRAVEGWGVIDCN
jgi:hypothetical protein